MVIVIPNGTGLKKYYKHFCTCGIVFDCEDSEFIYQFKETKNGLKQSKAFIECPGCNRKILKKKCFLISKDQYEKDKAVNIYL